MRILVIHNDIYFAIQPIKLNFILVWTPPSTAIIRLFATTQARQGKRICISVMKWIKIQV